MKRRSIMKVWFGLVALIALSLSPAMVVRAAELEDRSGSSGMSQSTDIQDKWVTGKLTHIEGWHYTIKESTGEEVSFGVRSATKDPHKVKEGDHIVAMIGEDRIALSIKNMKMKN
jgi:hypothetical protein